MGFVLASGAHAVELDANRPVIVGRSRTADLVLADPRVSRRHLEATLVGDSVRLRVIEQEASAFVIDGRAHRTAVVGAGTRIVVGDSVLTVDQVVAPGARTAEPTRHGGGIAEATRGLSAISDLIAWLDACEDIPSIEATARRWALEHVGATTCELGEGSAPTGAHVIALAAEGTARQLMLKFRSKPAPLAVDLARVGARQIGSRLADLARLGALAAEHAVLRTAAVGSAREFLGESRQATTMATRLGKLARSEALALLTGESGTGKTFAARLIHEASPRAAHPLRILNCAAIPDGLFEAELFGSERGAFSGAVAARTGAFEAVGRGTLVLDEIGDMPLASQAKLLHVLEARSFERVGSNRALPLEARVLAATNRDLPAMVEAGTFRGDLYFRISVVTVTVPPLRERGRDIAMLAERMLADLAPGAGRRITGFAPDALGALSAYGWPGNVRELRNVVEHAIVMGDGSRITVEDLPERITAKAARPRVTDDADVVTLPARLDELEERAIAAALRATGNNRTKAATLLGINRVTLQNKLGPHKQRR